MVGFIGQYHFHRNLNQLTPSLGISGDVVTCQATATDNSGGMTTDSISHTITNTPPIVTELSLNPESQPLALRSSSAKPPLRTVTIAVFLSPMSGFGMAKTN